MGFNARDVAGTAVTLGRRNVMVRHNHMTIGRTHNDDTWTLPRAARLRTPSR